MIPSDQFALAHKEDLHNRIGIVHGHGNDVPVFHTAAGDLLLLCHLLHAGKQIPVLRRFFIFHFFSSFHHLFFQAFQQIIIMSV